MRETKFIEQNREKWAEFEAMLRDNQRDPEKLNELFIQITDDLSYARTHYPHRSVRLFLNSLAQRIFHNVYRGRRFPARQLKLFWAEELPRLFWDTRRALWLSFGLFTLAFLVGVFSSMYDPDFAKAILSEGYVQKTIRNINAGDPMAVYKDSPPLGMSISIAANNLFVALRTAIYGVLASIGTVFILLQNGVMVGAFQYFFIERGLFWESFLTIWIHGTLEISAIIVAGAAGLVAGSGLLFPGTYTRGQAFKLSMRRGLKIFIGLVPVLLLAAFFEGFLTRFTETPDVVRLLFILSSLAFVLWYFVWLPWHKARTGPPALVPEKTLQPSREEVISFTSIKNAGELVADAFTLLRRQARLGWTGIAVAALLFTGLAGWVEASGTAVAFVFPRHLTGAFQGWWEVIGRNRAPVLFWGQVGLFYGMFWLAVYMARREMPEALRAQWRGFRAGLYPAMSFLLTFVFVWLLEAVEFGFFLWLIGIALFPFLSLWMAASCFERNSWRSLGRSWQLMNWGQGLLVGFLTVNFGLLFLLFLDPIYLGPDQVLEISLWYILLEFFSWLVPPQESSMHIYVTYATAFAVSFIVQVIWMLFMLSGILHYFSSRERVDAVQLRSGIGAVGSARKIRGLARE